jgi:hypothetical protein
MPDNTTNVAVPAGTWTEAVAGPETEGKIEALLTGSDNFEYAYAPSDTPPSSGFLGHFAFAKRNEPVVVLADQSVFVFNATRAMNLAVTTSEVE